MRPWVQWPARAVLLTASTGAAGAGASVAFGGASAATTLSDNQARSPVGSPVSDCESAATVLADPVVGRENVTVGHKDEAQGTSPRALGMRSSRWSLRPGLPAAIGQLCCRMRQRSPALHRMDAPFVLGLWPAHPASKSLQEPVRPIAAALHSVAALPVMADMRLLSKPQRGMTRAGRPLSASVLSLRSSPGVGIRSLFCLAIGALMAGAAALMAAGGRLRDARRRRRPARIPSATRMQVSR